MENINSFLSEILQSNEALNNKAIERVLILYEETDFFIGDTCLKFHKLRFCKLFFSHADIDIVWTNDTYSNVYTALLKNNPYISKSYCQDWNKICFEEYDLIICITYDETKLLHILYDKYHQAIFNAEIKLLVFSLSKYIFKDMPEDRSVFPMCMPLITHAITYGNNQPHELYITQQEKEWGNQWLRSKGLQPEERLFVVLDSSSGKRKLLNIDVYAEVISFLLKQEKVKLLIFDEKGRGKEIFYREWLGDEKTDKIIFSKEQSLREDLCILSSDYTRLILGPCTGLLHCASGIYNHFLKSGMPYENVPLMITYTGKYLRENETAYSWWRNCPLINCLVIRKFSDKKKAVLLSDLSEMEKVTTEGLLPCNEYTSSMLIDFIESRIT